MYRLLQSLPALAQCWDCAVTCEQGDDTRMQKLPRFNGTNIDYSWYYIWTENIETTLYSTEFCSLKLVPAPGILLQQISATTTRDFR